jgi:hypothetical protein
VLGFVTSLPHPANCRSYPERCDLLTLTLASILAQTAPDIRVVVVANARPTNPIGDARVEVVLVPFAPSASPAGAPTAVWGIYEDKGAKLAVGTSALVAAGASHVMIVDSDDFVHRGLAAHVAAHGDDPGWFSPTGYFHVRGSRTVRVMPADFHQRNGSTHIVRTDLLAVPPGLDPTLSRDGVLDTLGRERTVALLGRHRPIVEHCAAAGAPLVPLPFPSAIWEIGTGENFSQVLAAAGERLPVEGRIAHDYGLPVPSRGTAAASAMRSAAARLGRRVARLRSPGSTE